MKKYIIIKADTNDADYVQEKHEVTDDILRELMPVINAIKEYTDDKSITYQKWNYWAIEWHDRGKPTPKELYVDTGKCTLEQLELFDQYLPYAEHGIHSIESVEILEVSNEYKLL